MLRLGELLLDVKKEFSTLMDRQSGHELLGLVDIVDGAPSFSSMTPYFKGLFLMPYEKHPTIAIYRYFQALCLANQGEDYRAACCNPPD